MSRHLQPAVSPLLSFPLLVAAITAQLSAQLPELLPALPRELPRSVMPKAIADSLSVDPAQDRVVVKLAEGRPELADGRHILAPDICAVIGERLVRPYFEGLEVELAALRQRQLAATPPGRTPDVDLGLYYEVTTQNAADTRLLVQRLNELAAVELAYARALPTPPPGDILPVTPDFTLFQGYRAAAPAGVDADALLYTTGGSGSGVRVLDIEFSWQLQHEDIAALRPSSVVGPIPGPNYEDHGSAVAGVIAADADIYGVTGLAPDVELRVTTAQVFAWVDVPGAIATAMTALTAGDVLLIELQVGGPLGYLPVEWEQATFDAIRIASGLGITVVEPAGNGSVDLDHPSLGGLFDTNVRDSGAIVVAASGAGIATRASFSNYGARIDCNGWGYWVMTTGYGTQFDPGDQRQRYATAFGGTSSASAMVTGVVAGLRGAAEAQLSPQDAAALDPTAIRTLLRTTGTPASIIKNRPDAAALLTAAGIRRGLAMRGEPRTGATAYVDLTPTFTAGANDLWSFVGSLSTDNRPMPGNWSGRILLGTPATPLDLGTFTSPTASLAVPVPAVTSLRGLRFHVQGFTFEAASGQVTASNAVQVYVRR